MDEDRTSPREAEISSRDDPASDEARVASFSLAGAAGRGHDGFASWREVVSPVFVADRKAGRPLDTFDIGFHGVNLGPLLLGTTHSVGQTFRRDAATIARSGVDHVIVQTYIGGGSEVTTGAGQMEVGPGDVWLFDMSRTLSTVTTEQFSNVSLTVPRGLIEPLVGDVDGLHGLKLTGNSPLGGLLGQHILGLEARAPLMTLREATAVVDATVQLIAGCVGPALEARETVAGAMASALLARVRRSIDDHLGAPELGPEFLMRRHGLSRARLYRLFEPLGGVADYIRRRRLGRCFLDLAAPAQRDVKIAAIGYRWGFGNEATFSRAFKARFGVTPSEVRAGVRPEASGETPGGEGGETQLLGQWLRRSMER